MLTLSGLPAIFAARFILVAAVRIIAVAVVVFSTAFAALEASSLIVAESVWTSTIAVHDAGAWGLYLSSHRTAAGIYDLNVD